MMAEQVVDGMTLPHCAKGVAVCTVAKLNVRMEPSIDAAIMGVLIKDEAVNVWALYQGWMLVQAVNGLTGWAAAQYLSVVGELAP